MSALDPIERAIRAACAAVDIDHGLDASGELPDREVDTMFAAIHAAGRVDLVAIRTAGLVCVEPQLPDSLAAEALRRLDASAELRAGDWTASPVGAAAFPSGAAWECLTAACACAAAPDAQSWRRMLRAYRAARLPSGARPRVVANLWLDWAGRVVPAATGSSIHAELSSLREMMRTARPVPTTGWFFDASVGENGLHFVSIAERATRRTVRDVLSGTMRHVGRLMQWEVRSLDSIPLGRLRAEELVERVILSDLANGYYEGRFDRIEYTDTSAGDTWARDVAP